MIFLFLFYRQHGTVPLKTRYYFYNSFGFLENATATFEFALSDDEADNARLKILMMTRKENQLFTAIDHSGIEVFYCDNYTSAWMDDIILRKGERVNYTTRSKTKQVIYPLIMSCDCGLPGKYQVDYVFDNINTLLDYREIPSLTVFPIMLALTLAIAAATIIAQIVMKRKFLAVHYFIILMDLIYAFYLLLKFITLKHGVKSDQMDSFSILCEMINCLFDIALFSFFIIASSGWCIMHTELTKMNLFLTILGTSLFITSIFIYTNVDLGYYIFLIIAINVAAGCLIARQIFINFKNSKDLIFAHFIVIRERNIDPLTTPIYLKYKIFEVFILVTCASFLVMLIFILFFTYFYVDTWIGNLINCSYVLFMLIFMSVTYRPRGPNIDKYMQVDEDNEERLEVQLEDINEVSMRTFRDEHLQKWEDGMDLPLQPKIKRRSVYPGNVSLMTNDLSNQYSEPLNPSNE